MTDVVLFDYWRSSASYRLRIALNLAGIEYQSIPVDLVKGEQRSPEHLARNPQGFVPVLEIDGLRLTQSLAILDYLDQTRDLNLLPKAPAERAKAQALAQSIAVDLHPVCNLAVARHATQLSGGREDMPKAWMQHFIRPGLQAFEALLAGFEQAPYCTGDAPGLADICLMPQIYNARRWEVDISDMPRLLAVEEACAQHPAFAAAHPDAVQPTA
ncbi:maleylacetoacetate isomerase [Phaeobacter gallaeciensis]|uniref:maleylacetoacetate isomerase n=1 Tax=Phaeobacter gallaeciensis TaxID=60890 RepID=UPI00237F3285|nr:maleylacetoacetate isomerase [Phaeobacter gallaeciensis]MDE4098449.1 maleylacetoacetate isomerase [Phaeobacter gallaeciensis]MDE4107259.1 maleylacetoacetate isomerase [Phaeobacter gallaeciensis]MDE4111789.1 maleylacetoacetate isomerase [Phaeobacter gallaeciensis]MDE4116184.1 maleylacetoacetate isomerase [Phaeobacter gallaeciensis]MDE4120655.1 maleylacetoacetate isomerase [Phaeobacter gallaeciensis]